MDGDRRSAQVERLEVVDTGRRRRWSEDEKLKIVLESLQAPRQVAATARRYGISRSLLLRWRRSFQPEPKDAAQTYLRERCITVLHGTGNLRFHPRCYYRIRRPRLGRR